MTEKLVFQTAAELIGRIRSREVSVLEVLDAHLKQIEDINPIVNAFCTLDEERAREYAKKLDHKLAHGTNPGPLYGLPIGIKDLSATKGIRTTKGSPIYANWIPDYDDLIVERFKKAGAIVIGKTNTPEFGAGSQTFNSVFGKTLNPYDLTKTCGGSSGGSAVSLACGMIPIASGSDLGGSLRNPAAWSNVVGMRTSIGRVPIYPTGLPFNSLSVAGPMARTVQDLSLQLSVVAGPDPRVPMSLPEAGEQFLNPLMTDFRGIKLAWSPDLGGYPIDPTIIEQLEHQIKIFSDLGCEIENASPNLKDADEIFQTIRGYQFAFEHKSHLENHRDQLKKTVIWNTESGLKLLATDIAQAENKRAVLHKRIMEFMDEYDFLLCPVTSVWPFSIDQEYISEINGIPLNNYIEWMAPCYAITVSGLPAISIPAGFSKDGLPLGLQIVGKYREDFQVLQLASAFENATEFNSVRPRLSLSDNS
ncbi:MAG: amidase [Chloroflexi bacterium]|jgi:amidase|nr:MAG: amidase [Chloroflexota bacterium]